MYGMQKTKLHYNEEQADNTGQTRIQQVLQILQKAYATQRVKIIIFKRKVCIIL